MIGSGGYERARLHAELSARMVEVGAKDVTEREAQAECVVTMTPEACAQLVAPLVEVGADPRDPHLGERSARRHRLT